MFGNENSSHPYLTIANERVHRIVATAFHGSPPDPQYVVDHIDTNCRNNRPENLRWLTRLENTLKNPVTRKKIEYLCGSIEAFLENPSMLNDLELESNFSWMRSVTKEEAQNCKDRMSIWVNTENRTCKTSNRPSAPRRSFERSVYKPLNKFEAGFGREPGLDITKTLWCASYMFNANNFLQCPEVFDNNRVEEYFENIKAGEIFATTDIVKEYPDYYFSLSVLKAVIQKEKQAIIVLCEKSDKTFMIVGIELYSKNNWFIHYNLGSYKHREEAEAGFIERQSVEVSEFFSLGYKNAYT